MFSITTTIFNLNDLDELLDDIQFIKTNKRIEYANVSCAFDIETTSFYNENQQKCATMYAFVFGINGKCVIGRTWADFLYIINKVSNRYALTNERRLIIYIHNLAYEFQFIRKLFEFEKVFAIDERKPIYALTDIGIEFRCSYLLSGYSLETVGRNLNKYKVNKMVGDLDYSLMRHSKTPLTAKELGYILNDGLVVMAYIQEQIEQLGDITKLPLTKTGYVRNYCRNMCMYSGGHKKDTKKFFNYRAIMNSLQIKSEQEYDQLKRAFQGGFTHGNAIWINSVAHNVTSYDFTSSYPAVMVMEQFPMGMGKLVTINNIDELKKYMKLYCCLFDITLKEVESITSIEHPISLSKCFNLKNYSVDNGRIVDADELTTTITEQDFMIFRKFYKWKSMTIRNFRIYKKGYLPTQFVKSILKLYYDKTTLKGVKGMEIEYLKSKEQLNACYGMTVTDICREEIVYDPDTEDVWTSNWGDNKKSIQKYNNSIRRFLYYPWGIWVTAYARRNLFTGIYACGTDYVYSDTDSIKCVHMEKHMDYINDYNNKVKIKLERACKFHNIPFEQVAPKTKNGVVKMLGVWDFDGFYTRFKTLGAKRYMVENEDGINITISGVNKKCGVPYLEQTYKDPFKAFDDGLKFPSTYYSKTEKCVVSATGKNTHTYIDDSRSGELTDYLGTTYTYHELSSVHMEGADYELSLAKEFVKYIMGVRLKIG